MRLLHRPTPTDGYMGLPPLIFSPSPAVAYLCAVCRLLSALLLLFFYHTGVNQLYRSMATVQQEPPVSRFALLTVCLSVFSLRDGSWWTTEWSSASGGWPSSKALSSPPMAQCSITTLTLRARSSSLGPRWSPSLKWMQMHPCRCNTLLSLFYSITYKLKGTGERNTQLQ